MNARKLLAAIVVFASSPGFAADYAQGGEGAAALDPITVTRPIAPLDEPYERLREMMEDPYCKGCPALIEVDRESAYLKVGKTIGFLTGYGQTLPDPGHEDRLDFHIANDWRQAERLPEN